MGEKKGWNIKGLFIQQDETAEETATQTPEPTPTDTGRRINYASPTSAPTTGNPGAFEGQLRDTLNSSGSEYVRFRTACDELRSALPDEATRLKSAFVTMKAFGVTKDKLVSTAKVCIGNLANEQSEFENAMNTAYANQVEGGAGNITSIDKQIEEKLSQISSLQVEVDRLRSDKSKITSEVEQSRNKIDTARRDFAAAYNKLVGEINSDINKITSSL